MKNTHLLFMGAMCASVLFISCENENENEIQTAPQQNVLLDSNEILDQWIDEALAEQPLTKSDRPVKTVDFVDVDRYTGRWFEIANYPTSFNGDCSCTTADYAPIAEGLSVLNNCTSTVTGEFNTIQGKAVVVDSDSNAKLQVFFGQAPFPGDYWIIDLVSFNENDPYDLAVVSGPSRKALFILSRKPLINTFKQKVAVIKILINLIKQGYDISKIQISPQSSDCTYF